MCVVKISRNFTVDVDVYEKCREMGVNLSEAAEEGMRARLGGKGEGKDPGAKFRGLPAHLVSKVKRLMSTGHNGLAWRELQRINEEYGKDLHLDDVERMMARF